MLFCNYARLVENQGKLLTSRRLESATLGKLNGKPTENLLICWQRDAQFFPKGIFITKYMYKLFVLFDNGAPCKKPFNNISPSCIRKRRRRNEKRWRQLHRRSLILFDTVRWERRGTIAYLTPGFQFLPCAFLNVKYKGVANTLISDVCCEVIQISFIPYCLYGKWGINFPSIMNAWSKVTK